MPHGAQRGRGAVIALAMSVLAAASTSAGVARSTAATDAQAAGDAPWIAQVRIYVRAITEHEPGSADMSAQIIGSWQEGDLDAARLDLLILQSICRRGTGRARLPAGVVARRESSGTSREDAVALLGLAEAPDLPLLGLAQAPDLEREMNLMIERGAVLHADIAMRVTPFRVDNVGCSSRATMSVIDGQVVGYGCSNYHWRMGRALLDGLPPDPSADRFASLWYHATISFLLEQTNYSDALPQITRARERFPGNAVMQFEHGCYQEALAAPRVQALAGSMRGTLLAPRTHLNAAESSFRRAIKLDSGLIEAQIRLGAVLTQLERYREAAAILQPALEHAQDSVLHYYAEMFLARAAEGLGDLPAARDHYARASAAKPAADAPQLALGRLARSAGDRARAAEHVRRAIEAQGLAGQASDPWWVYYRWQSRNSESLLRELHRSIEPGGRQ